MEELIPRGYKFTPTDEELLDYLRRKVEGVHVHHLHDHERYFFAQTVQVSKSGNGKRVKRDMEGDSEGGWWKATSGDKKIVDKQDSRITLGYFKTLKFFKYKDRNRIRNQAYCTDWLMHEYKLTNQTFQEWVICRIKDNTKDKKIKADSNLTAHLVQQPVVLPAVAIHNEEIILTGTTTDHDHDHDHQDQLQPQPVLESYHINSHVDAISTVEGDHEHDKSKFVDDNMEEQHDEILKQILLELDDVDDSSTESDDDDDLDQLQPQFALESRHMNYHGRDAVNTVGDRHHDHDHEHDMSLGDNSVDLEQRDQIFMLHNPTTEQQLDQLVQELQLGPQPFLEPHLDWLETPMGSIDLEFQFPRLPDDFSDIEAFLCRL
ncbi:Protein CUP-SHAPED COTYLEDON 3 [Morus notabilis]|uniref:Protein CUP-SHAPED COTYLEDON 3 n=1 Tax=Morus notabilis TaxID=981085 RepID=W9QVM0_9ROSA|nr:NAC transcription factor 29 [Morus notabilis]EXB55201.1 Protein CUP-SHAPED COTYLEDON 3 [Morus notabilis]